MSYFNVTPGKIKETKKEVITREGISGPSAEGSVEKVKTYVNKRDVGEKVELYGSRVVVLKNQYNILERFMNAVNAFKGKGTVVEGGVDKKAIDEANAAAQKYKEMSQAYFDTIAKPVISKDIESKVIEAKSIDDLTK